MCNFFSFVGDGYGNYKFFDWKQRKARNFVQCDSHTEILTDAGLIPELQDRWSRYEYNPLLKSFVVDQGVEGHDHAAAESWVQKLDFKLIVQPIILKDIVHPFKLKKRRPTKADVALLAEWASGWDSVGAYIASFFDIVYKYDFSSCIKLWERGLVPSYDGKTWRLHSGSKASIVYEWTPPKGTP